MIGIEVAEEFSRKIYEDGREAYKNPDHPCHPFVKWQREHGCREFQLTEPYSGRYSNLSLAFIGLNPGFEADEIMPTALECASFEEYDSFYRGRFDDKNRSTNFQLLITAKSDHSKKPRYWNQIETFGTEYIRLPGIKRFRLGEHALLIETVRYKSTKSWRGYDKPQQHRVMDHERSFTRQLLEHLKPLVLVVVGGDALKELRKILTLGIGQKPPDSIANAVGHSFNASLGKAHSMIVCPVRHFSPGTVL